MPIDKLIQAEKNFAAFSVANSTKEAFLEFLDSTGIVFANGKAVNGIEAWQKREKRPGVLNWQPQFAEISLSGDFGYTTGPWTFQPKTINDSVVARGQYTTVWHINKEGEWKFLVDLGSENTPLNLTAGVKRITVHKENAKLSNSSSLVNAENDFIKLSEQNKTAAYKKYLSGESILNRNKNLPGTIPAEKKMMIDSLSATVKYTMDGWGISSANDMGYVYGISKINGKADNYLRIWRKEKAGWKIAVEVLRY